MYLLNFSHSHLSLSIHIRNSLVGYHERCHNSDHSMFNMNTNIVIMTVTPYIVAPGCTGQ